MSLGNTGLLNQDPVHDRAPLYGQLLHTYKWSDKLHEYAGVASSILSSNTLKRSTTMSSIATKRLRRPGPTIHAVPQHNVDSLVSSLALLFPQEMTVQLIRPMGSSAILKITLGQTLRAVVVLRSLIIEWVVVKAISEDHHVDDHKPETVWSSSRYKVFQKVTDHANSAMLHFYSPNMPELAVKSFMTWFRSYNTLFSHPCQRCGRLLSDNLPPTWRDFRNTTAYHENCRQ
ncbi:PREDICTED: mediator of RNA polymerase II transcription subunit 27-A-like [Priapulus caudatus]|uniref:Mediator of RNA polymerase II transcription subunit 27-A-like n=1 Tax=Priapulus caudatus TaxID=37621 RepID=A0ABM1E7X8_PRICU|nr:PREDICTED: mediator of RNA polymerase II transcription subunit 27-A-like [Priapulus caudatus]